MAAQPPLQPSATGSSSSASGSTQVDASPTGFCRLSVFVQIPHYDHRSLCRVPLTTLSHPLLLVPYTRSVVLESSPTEYFRGTSGVPSPFATPPRPAGHDATAKNRVFGTFDGLLSRTCPSMQTRYSTPLQEPS